MVLAPCSSSLPKLLLKPGRWTVGSAATCSYRVAGDGVRPRHALVLCGGQATVLKAWDSHTWHNGQRVSGEVRLQPGDHVTLGSVEFSIESEDDVIDVAAMLIDLPQASIQAPPDLPAMESPISPSLPHKMPSEASDSQPEGWDLERLREQIHELRDELSQRVLRRSGAVVIEQTPATSHDHDAELASTRVMELEQAATEARRLAEQAQEELAIYREEQARREAELRQVADELRPALEIAQQNDSELRRELDQLRLEAAQREQLWEQQTATWSAEREQLQDELVSVTNARQQLAAEWEQRQSTNIDDATHWKTECEQLRAAWQLQQAAWENERSQTRDDFRRQEEAAQQTQQTATQREQELAERVQQLLAEQEQIEVERQQQQTEQLERDQAIAALAEERQHVEQHAAEVLAKFEDFSRRTSEFEQQQANLTREQQTLEHSWNWLQSDRRKLVEEKEAWQQQQAHWQAECERWVAESEQLQRDREEFTKARDLWHEQHSAAEQLTVEFEQLVTERRQLQADQSAWATQREQFETEHQTAADELEAVRTELHSQQQAIYDEQARLEALRTELEAHPAEIQHDQDASIAEGSATSSELATRNDPETSSWASTSRLEGNGDWNSGEACSPPSMSISASPTEVSSSPLSDAWSIGVDLTAPRETHTVERRVKSESLTGWTTSSVSGPAEEVASPVELQHSEAASTTQSGNDWDVAATSPSANDSDLAQPADPAVTLGNASSDPQTEEAEAAPSTGPVVSILESMAFAEDEDVDESVSRYMQHLLARSPLARDGERDRYIPVSAVKKPNVSAETTTKPFSKAIATDDQTPLEPAVVSKLPTDVAQLARKDQPQAAVTSSQLPRVPQQDREAIRAATEQMRQVANQQTVKNVEAANWKQIRRSIKTKLILAALSFVLSAGLLYWGYYYRPEFMILGILTSGLGVVTWLDLLLAFRQAHIRASQLTGRKKPSGKAKS